MEESNNCDTCGGPKTKTIQAGVSKAGKSYSAFQACPIDHREGKGGTAPSGGSQGGASGSLGAQVGNALKLGVETALAAAAAKEIKGGGPLYEARADYLGAVLAYAQNYMEIGNKLQGEFGDKPNVPDL